MKEVNKIDAMEQKRQYTAPHVKVFDFGLSDVVCASGCTGDGGCGGDAGCPSNTCSAYEVCTGQDYESYV